MPQPEATSLLTRVLLLWITVLTMGLLGWVAFTAIYFTGTNLQQNGNQPTTEAGKALAQMMDLGTHDAGKKVDKIEWKKLTTNSFFISIRDEIVTIEKDGYYFLSLKVTLDNESFNEHTVRLSKSNEAILEDVIRINSNSTRLLGKVQSLSNGDMLKVTINPPAKINDTSVATYMGLIYIPSHT